MTGSIAEVIATPETYGVSFVDSNVSKGVGSNKAIVGSAPILTVVDFGKFEANFPGVLLKHSNGQSVRVHAQAITRNMLVADRAVSRDKMIEAQVKGICFGQTVSVTVKTVTVEKVVEVDFSTEKRAMLIAELVDNGMDVATAQAIAAKM